MLSMESHGKPFLTSLAVPVVEMVVSSDLLSAHRRNGAGNLVAKRVPASA